jgi:transposase-like protein
MPDRMNEPLNGTDYANGFKPKTVMTRVVQFTFDVPQVRGGGFYPSALEQGARTEQALNIALPRCMRRASPPISSMPALRSGANGRWMKPRMSLLDARYERVRESGCLVDCAVLVAVGITRAGHCRVLGVSVALSED